MPTYQYKCEKCGPFEIWQSIKDNALSACPTCGSKVQRLISSNVGFVFKGSGFYQNEYKNPPSAAQTTNSSPDSAKAPQDKKPESKPSVGEAPGCGTCASPDPCGSGNN